VPGDGRRIKFGSERPSGTFDWWAASTAGNDHDIILMAAGLVNNGIKRRPAATMRLDRGKTGFVLDAVAETPAGLSPEPQERRTGGRQRLAVALAMSVCRSNDPTKGTAAVLDDEA